MQTFDNYEVSAVILVDRLEDGTEILEPVDDVNPEEVYCWTVYGHLLEGGVEALADCPTEEVANFIYNTLMEALRPIKEKPSWNDIRNGLYKTFHTMELFYGEEIDDLMSDIEDENQYEANPASDEELRTRLVDILYDDLDRVQRALRLCGEEV